MTFTNASLYIGDNLYYDLDDLYTDGVSGVTLDTGTTPSATISHQFNASENQYQITGLAVGTETITLTHASHNYSWRVLVEAKPVSDEDNEKPFLYRTDVQVGVTQTYDLNNYDWQQDGDLGFSVLFDRGTAVNVGLSIAADILTVEGLTNGAGEFIIVVSKDSAEVDRETIKYRCFRLSGEPPYPEIKNYVTGYERGGVAFPVYQSENDVTDPAPTVTPPAPTDPSTTEWELVVQIDGILSRIQTESNVATLVGNDIGVVKETFVPVISGQISGEETGVWTFLGRFPDGFPIE